MSLLNNKVKIVAHLLLFLVLLGCAREPIQHNILRSMAEFDRIYIPALLFTNLQKQRESEIALERLSREWNGFNRKFYGVKFKYGVNITDRFWKEDFERVNTLITTAEVLVIEEKLPEAYGKLEKVRIAFRELRHRNGLDYFLDGIHEFHSSMEQILLTLRGKDNLTDKDLDGLRSLFKQAQASWAKVARSEVDPELFGFDPEKIKAIRKRVKDEEMMLAGFAAALSSKDTDNIFQAATDLKPNFVVLYKAFGDFQPIFERVIKEKRTSSASSEPVTSVGKE